MLTLTFHANECQDDGDQRGCEHCYSTHWLLHLHRAEKLTDKHENLRIETIDNQC